ncbi:MAG: hypothetical protein ACYS80_02065 [Planctomycetota bacterium]|jgi:hypothetical protein
MKARLIAISIVVLVLSFILGQQEAFAQINVITVDINPFVPPGFYSYGPGNTMGMALQAVDQGADFNVTEVTPTAFSAMTAAQLSAYDLIAINNHPGQIAGGLGTVWHSVVGVATGGRVVLSSHDAPRYKMTVPPWGGYPSPGPGLAPFGTHDLIRQAALWAGGVPGLTGLLIFNDAARFPTVGGVGWNNVELALPAAWGITDADQSSGGFAPGGGYTDILPAYAAHPLYVGLSDARFGVNSISSFAANIVDSSFHSIFASYNSTIFTPTEVIINSGVIDPGGYGGSMHGWATVSAPDGTAITLIRNSNQPPVCDNAYADPDCLWPPNHKIVAVHILGVTDPDGDPVTITITGITSDEPTASDEGAGGAKHAPDATGVGTDTAQLRAERSGKGGNGRVYEISFTASDGVSGECEGSVVVCVPHDQSGGDCECIDDGQNYDATQIN